MSFSVVIVKDTLKTGRNTDRATAVLANALNTRGFRVSVLTLQSSRIPYAVTFDAGIICYRIRPPRLLYRLRFLNKLFLRTTAGAWILRWLLPFLDLTLGTSRRVQKRLRELAPDIVLSSGSDEAVLLTYAGPLGLPFIQMFHLYPPAYFANGKLQRIPRFIRALHQAEACQVLLPSHREMLRNKISAPIEVIGDAIPYPTDEPLPPPERREKTILYAARFGRDKNQLTLLEAYAKLGDTDWTLCLYGTGTPEWENSLRRRAASLNIAHRVQFFGIDRVPRPVLSRAGICAFPSLSEGFGLALAEAMWCGLPCVGLATAPGVCELITHEANGLLAPTPDANALSTQLRRLTDSPDLRIRLGITAAKFARATYSADRIAQQWEDLLLSTLKLVKKTPQTP